MELFRVYFLNSLLLFGEKRYIEIRLWLELAMILIFLMLPIGVDHGRVLKILYKALDKLARYHKFFSLMSA